MATIISDGTGEGNSAKVDKDNKLHVQSLAIPYEDFAVLNGDSFVTTSGIQVLTTANFSYLLHLANTNTHTLIVSNIIIDMGASTGGSANDWEVDFHLSPTGGTLITAGSVGFVSNNNLGSPKILESGSLTGVEGSTITGGVPVVFLIQGEKRFMQDQKVAIPPGSSFAIGVKPPTGNTSVSASITITLIKQTIDFN